MLVWNMTLPDKNDISIFGRLYDAYADDVFKRTLRILKNKEDAEDAMQNTWQSVAENLSFFREKSDTAVRAYLLRIARNQAISILREKQKNEAFFADADVTAVPDDADTEAELFLASEQTDIEHIRRCLEELDAPYRDVLVFYYLYGHSTKEIAKLLRLNENTVRTRLVRGRARLADLLGKEEKQ